MLLIDYHHDTEGVWSR